MSKKHPKAEQLRDYARSQQQHDDDEIAKFLNDKADVIDQQAARIRQLKKENATLKADVERIENVMAEMDRTRSGGADFWYCKLQEALKGKPKELAG